MSSTDFLAMLPHLVLGGAIVLLMLVIAFVRNHALTATLTALSMLASLLAIGPSLEALPRQVTPLFVFDSFGAFFSGLILIAGIATVVFSYRYLQGRRGDLDEYYLLLAIATFGAMTLAAATHFAGFLLGLEIVSISLYTLIAYPEEGHPPLEAGLKYLVLSGVASTTILFGLALLYNATGSMEFHAAGRALTVQSNYEVYLAAGNILVFAGLAFKLSLVPFHMWTPDVYQGAPAPVSGFIATASKGAVVALVYRYLIGGGALDDDAMVSAIAAIAIASMVIGNVLALMQRDLKRILAYSSIAHLGYLMIALLAIDALTNLRFALEAGLIYLAAYFAMTLAAFGIVALLSSSEQQTDASDLDDYEGLFWRQPWVAGVLTITLLSLAGIPMTAGFIAKFYLISAGVEGSMWVLLWALILGSAIGIYYYLRVIFTMTAQPETTSRNERPVARGAFAVVCLLGLTILGFGVYPTPLITLVGYAVSGMAGGMGGEMGGIGG